MASPRHPTGFRTSVVLLVLVLVGVLIGSALVMASASSLDIEVQGPSWVQREACTTHAVVAPSVRDGALTTQVVVAGPAGADLPAGCLAVPVRLVLFSSTGDMVADVHDAVTDGRMDLPVGVPTAQVAGASVVLGGFVVPTSWAAPVATDRCEVREIATDQPAAGLTCEWTLDTTNFGFGNENWQHYIAIYRLTIHNSAGASQNWIPTGYAIDFDLHLPSPDQPAWWHWENAGIQRLQPLPAFLTITSGCGELPRIAGTVVGQGNNTLTIELMQGVTSPPGTCVP